MSSRTGWIAFLALRRRARVNINLTATGGTTHAHIQHTTCGIVERRHLVDDLPRVHCPRNAEREFEIEALQQPVAEVMPFNHPEVWQRLISDLEFQSAA